MNKKAGIIGWPVSHSLSPRLHNFWLKRYGIHGEYVALPVEPQALAATLKTLAEKNFCGVNLTIPHKEAALTLLDTVDETAKAIGAVNTIIVTPQGALHGTNTDAYGFLENIKRYAPLDHKNKAVVLGAGGAARAVCKALQDAGFAQIVLTNRTQEKAERIAAQLGEGITPGAWDVRNNLLENADLLVNTTSLGMQGKEPLILDLSKLPRRAIVNDIVYAPLVTPLLAAARARGHIAVDGLGMLIHQAVPAFEAWFGRRPDVDDEVRALLLEPAP